MRLHAAVRTTGTNRPGVVHFFRGVWKCGGWRERFFVSLLLMTAIVGLGVPIWMLLQVANNRLPIQVMFSFVLASSSGGAYLGAWVDSLYNATFIRESLQKGWAPGERTTYLREYLRYIEDHGKEGRFPGDGEWAAFSWAIYYFMLVVAVAYTLAVLPLFGPIAPYTFAALDAPVVLGLYVATGLRNKRKFEDAEKLGYRLLQLYGSRRRAAPNS